MRSGREFMAGETSSRPTIAGFEISTRATPGISASLHSYQQGDFVVPVLMTLHFLTNIRYRLKSFITNQRYTGYRLTRCEHTSVLLPINSTLTRVRRQKGLALVDFHHLVTYSTSPHALRPLNA
jgi:hypothetical protein